MAEHLSSTAKDLLNKQVEAGLVTEAKLKDLDWLLDGTKLNNLDSNQLRTALVCDTDMAGSEFKELMEWTGSHTASLDNVTGDGITCLSNRWDDLGSMGAQDEAMKLLEQESAKMAASGEQMDVSDVKKVVKKAEGIVTGTVVNDVDILDLVKQVPNEYKKIFKCKEFAESLKNILIENGVKGEEIELCNPMGYIYSNKFGMISENKIHEAIRVGDIIYDNLYPEGILYSMWEKDLGIVEQAHIINMDIKPFGG